VTSVVALGGTGSHTRPAAPTAGLRLAFDQTFSGTQLDKATWGTCYPWFDAAKGCTNFGNSIRDAWYLPSGDRVSGGALRIVATKTRTHGFTQSGAPEIYPYTSGMVTTKKSFDFTYGYVQVMAKIPGGAGTWPAVWLLPKSETWPPEIDIMENFGSPYLIRSTVFWPTSDNNSGSYALSHKFATSPSNLTVGYHSYGLLWKPNSLTWYLDGNVIDTFTGPNVPHTPMYLLLNLAIDGKAASGSTFSIKSVKIYQSPHGS
jgi:beta-glucanase (GH16 family)